jgi:predicted O-methyltransferase YrrM
MISTDERRLLYTLARDYYTGAGRIIDGGAYLGSSSLSLGWGLKDQCYRKEPAIDAFDTFIIDAHSIAHRFKSQDAPGRR